MKKKGHAWPHAHSSSLFSNSGTKYSSSSESLVKRSDTASELSENSASDELLISSPARAAAANAAAADCIASGTVGAYFSSSIDFLFTMFMAVKAANVFSLSMDFVRGLITTIVAGPTTILYWLFIFLAFSRTTSQRSMPMPAVPNC